MFQKIRKARDRVRGSSKALDNVTSQLEALEGLLDLVKEEEGLQTAAVGKQLKAVIEVAAELESFFNRLTALQQRKADSQFLHMLRSGEADDEELEAILDRLDRTKQDLSLHISVAQVGVFGNLQDGFRVAFTVLKQTNAKVKEVLGTNLALMDLLRDRSIDQTGRYYSWYTR